MTAIPGSDDILRVTLENGITVLARENFASPSVVVSGVLRTGAHHAPPEKAGLAAFHTATLMRGTQSRTFAEIYETIESNGASMDIDAAGHTTPFGAKSLAEDLPMMLDLLSDVMRHPTFPEDHVEKVRGEMLTALAIKADNTGRMASQAFYELAYPDHPYSVSPDGYPETVQAIGRKDIADFQAQYVGPRGAIVVVVGAVRAEDAVSQVREALGDWEKADQPDPPTVPPAPALDEARERFVTIPGKSQADIVLGFPGPPRRAEDFLAANLANNILGVFGMMGRLGDNVREKQGLAYYVYSKLTGGIGPGPWTAIAGVDPANTGRAIDGIRAEIRRIVDEPVADEELNDVKSFVKGRLVLTLETNDGVASSLLAMEMHDLGLDYLRRYASEIDAITVEAVQAAAQRYLNPDAYALAIAGPAQA
jgi:zinc protease